ncbi:MAG: methyltransferase domain-containing protein [Gammaproteobacteria bacterium]|nr:methyltransferase domain-containing protein [Gammaproteobacteria bacterium]
MNITPAKNLACPIDKLELVRKETCYQCSNGHSFDIAKQGYINLLPVQHKKSKNPGDSKAMVQARTYFLDAGFYRPIADQLSKLIFNNIDNANENCIFDAGCGEGYYLQQIINFAINIKLESQLSFIGMDISKPAILAASKRNKQASWIVGTNSQPPLLDNSIDLIFSVFGFHSFDGFKNILKPGGKVILVEPGEKHLQELREIIYSEPASEKPESKTSSDSDYTLVETQKLEFKINLNTNEQILDLLTMTPHLFRASSEGKASIETMDCLCLSADIIFSVFVFNPETKII